MEEECFGGECEESIFFGGAYDRQRQGEIRSWYPASSSIPDNTQQDNGSAISAAAPETMTVVIWLLEAAV